jgi:flagellar hook-basal body complex protein FliE
MPLPIQPVGVQPVDVAGAIRPAGTTSKGDFASAFQSAVGRVEDLRKTADQGVERFLSGESEELHGTVLAVQRAELSFELFLQVRNKVVQAYQEIMRMQV